ncbi:MAG: hypothetical protein HXY24_10835 [Rubrivivax sp.]|nr:hypothetical protein [Rubrivivax sp.]
MKIRIPPDQTDLEHLRQTLETRGWQMIEARVREMIATAQAQLEIQEAGPELHRTQGQLAALRRVLQLPEILAREIRAREERRHGKEQSPSGL